MLIGEDPTEEKSTLARFSLRTPFNLARGQAADSRVAKALDIPIHDLIAEKKRRRSVVKVVVKVETEKKDGSPGFLEFEGRKIIRKPSDMPYKVAQEIIDKIEIGQMTGEEDGFRWAKHGF